MPGRPMKKLYVPWSLPGTFNGRHPLVAALIDDPALKADILLPRANFAYEDLERTLAEFTRFTAKMMDHFHGHRIVTEKHVSDFVLSRDLRTQLVRPADADLIFLHTVPNTTGATPWIIHIELPVNLFMPFVWQGNTTALKLRSLPVYWLVRYMLEQPECRAIFSHLKQTATELGPLFESEIIARKTHHIPLGVLTTPAQEMAIERIAAGRTPDDEVKLLFTNSFHQMQENFALRGGLDVLKAFFSASKRAPNLKLVLRSELPEALGSDFVRAVRSHPRIEVMDKKITDEELLKLYGEAQIFLVPAAALHALSVARAMHCGMVCIASDVPGYEEYIEDGVTGFLLPGRREAIYRREPETGWMRDNYATMCRPNAEMAANLEALLLRLAQSAPTRRTIGANARRWAQQHLSQAASIAAFGTMLDRLTGEPQFSYKITTHAPAASECLPVPPSHATPPRRAPADCNSA